MKRILVGITILCVYEFSILSSKELVCFDSIRILQEAKENQTVGQELQKKIEDLQNFVKDSQQKLVDMQSELDKKTSILSKDASQEQAEAIAQKKKDLERTLSDRKEKLEKEIQRKQTLLRSKQIEIINQVGERENWGLLIDKNAPGVVFASNSIDKTDIIIKEIDKKYESEKKEKAPQNKKA